MNPMWFIPMVMSVFGGVQQYRAGKEMEALADEQARMAQENKRLADMEVAESVRRQDIKDKRLLGSATARAAASGAEVSGSVSGYLDFMQDTQEDELAWMKKAGYSRARQELQAGLLQAESTRLQGKQQKYALFSSLAQGGMYAAQGGLFGSSPNFSGNAAPGFGVKLT